MWVPSMRFIGQRHRLRCYFGYRSRNTVISFIPVWITQYRVPLIARSISGEKKRAHDREREIGAIIKSVALGALSCGQSASKRNVAKRIRRSPVEITRRNDSQMLTTRMLEARHFPSADFARWKLCPLKCGLRRNLGMYVHGVQY